MAAFAGQNRPGTANTRSIVSAAVRFLSVTIVIVATPAWAVWQFVFEHLINDRDGINNQRIIRRPHSESNQLEKIAADNISRGMLASTVGNLNNGSVGISRSIGLFRNGGSDAHIVPGFSLHEFTSIGDHPGFEVRRKPVRVGEQNIRRDFFLSVVRKFRRAEDVYKRQVYILGRSYGEGQCSHHKCDNRCSTEDYVQVQSRPCLQWADTKSGDTITDLVKRNQAARRRSCLLYTSLHRQRVKVGFERGFVVGQGWQFKWHNFSFVKV